MTDQLKLETPRQAASATQGPQRAALPGGLVDSMEAANAYASSARSDGTKAVYARHWRAFVRWCRGHGLSELPAEAAIVSVYLAARAKEGRKVSTLRVLASAISQAHVRAGFPSPCGDARVREVFKGIRRVHGAAATQKAPLSTADLRLMLEGLPPTPTSSRDRALLLIGFAGGFRRSELVALEVGDLTFVREGLEVTLRRSKTDQEARGHLKTISYGSHPSLCPVRAMQDWLACAAISEGPVFRAVRADRRISRRPLSGHSVSLIVKRYALRIGLAARAFAGHSLRAGFVTEAKRNGADDLAIMEQTGHTNLGTVHAYHRRARAWERAASARLGL